MSSGIPREHSKTLTQGKNQALERNSPKTESEPLNFNKDSPAQLSPQKITDLLPNIAQFLKNTDISVREACSASYLEDLFYLPISQSAASELEDLRVFLKSFGVKPIKSIKSKAIT